MFYTCNNNLRILRQWHSLYKARQNGGLTKEVKSTRQLKKQCNVHGFLIQVSLLVRMKHRCNFTMVQNKEWMVPGIAIPSINWIFRKKPRIVEREFNRTYQQEYGSRGVTDMYKCNNSDIQTLKIQILNLSANVSWYRGHWNPARA